jgi:hypothetical protein
MSHNLPPFVFKTTSPVSHPSTWSTSCRTLPRGLLRVAPYHVVNFVPHACFQLGYPRAHVQVSILGTAARYGAREARREERHVSACNSCVCAIPPLSRLADLSGSPAQLWQLWPVRPHNHGNSCRLHCVWIEAILLLLSASAT